jgi:hypothetical protein
MIKLLPFMLKNWRGLFWVLFISLIFLLGYNAYKNTYRKIAFSHPKVKELVSKGIKLDSLVIAQEIQLEARKDDSLRYYKDIIQHQINGKELLNRATYAEGLLSQYKGQGACRYQEDSIVGNWPNRQKFTVWRTKPCTN